MRRYEEQMRRLCGVNEKVGEVNEKVCGVNEKV